ncbi:hypothetical protein V1477_008841, partial [Vespula maculifrons]
MEGKCYCMLDNIKIRMSLAQDLCIDSNYDGSCHVQRSKPSVKTSIRYKIRYFANNKENPYKGYNVERALIQQIHALLVNSMDESQFPLREETTFTRTKP